MTRALVLFAQPCEESFSAALKKVVTDRLAARGWEVDLCDLYAEGFDPVLTAAERRGYLDDTTNTAPVQAHVDRLRAAQVLVLVYPVWNFGFPAILKGYIDRVFLPGVSFTLEKGLVAPGLTHIRKLAVVTTYGATPFRAWAAGNPPKRVVTRALRFVCRPDRLRYLALYDMNRATPARRAAFMARVAAEMDRL
ncbi:MAG: NAD(P)H-dependent oxidoreductase [Rhodobacterales bacterium]|nr:NAD(P)H-dependent oxidoreductase [Rhodobacterales bacterium]